MWNVTISRPVIKPKVCRRKKFKRVEPFLLVNCLCFFCQNQSVIQKPKIMEQQEEFNSQGNEVVHPVYSQCAQVPDDGIVEEFVEDCPSTQSILEVPVQVTRQSTVIPGPPKKKQKVSKNMFQPLVQEKSRPSVQGVLTQENTFLYFVAAIWEDDKTLFQILEILDSAMKKALSLRQLGYRFKIYTWKQTVQKILHRLSNTKPSGTCSLTDFVRACLDDKYSTTFTSAVTKEQIELLLNVYETHFTEPSSLCPPMETTTTSSMTAPTVAPPVAVSESSILKTTSNGKYLNIYFI